MTGRKLLAILVLVVALPAYVVVAVTIVSGLDRPHIAVEVLIYVGLGVLWALPLRRLFLGIGRADPAAGDDEPPGQGRR